MALTPEEQIESTLRRASALIRRVDLGAALFTAAALAVFLLLGGILLDHFIPGGMPDTFRLVYSCAAGAVLLGVTLWRLYPLIRYRINPVYSASRLEEAHPRLKNALVNWLLVRGAEKNPFDRPFTRKTAEALPPGAASDAVDMSPLVRSAFWFIGALALLSAYLIAAERSCVVSAARVLMPAAEIAPPQRIRFRSVTPGNTQVRRGESVTITAEFDDLPPGEVRLVYATADGRLTGARLPMEPDSSRTLSAVFPETGEGVQEDILYEIQVADGEETAARSAEYRISVLPPLSFTVEEIACRYPAYTQLEPQTAGGDGDIDAWEGTEVTLTARSNYPLARAELIPDFDRRGALKMTVSPDEPTRAEVRFTLEPGRWTSYRLWCEDTGRNTNFADPEDARSGPPSRSVTVRPDPPPVAVWNDPPRDAAARVAEHGTLPLSFTGTDEQFGLARAQLELEWYRAARPAERTPVTVDLSRQLLRPGTDRRAPQTVTCDFSPAASGIPAGATVECRAVLYDNRPDEPGRGETDPLTLTVTRDGETPSSDEPDSDAGGAGNEGGKSGSGGGSDAGSSEKDPQSGEAQQQNSGGKDAEKNGEKNSSAQEDSSGEDPSEGESPSGSGAEQPAENQPQGGEEDNAEGTGESAGETASGDQGGTGSEGSDGGNTDSGDPADASPSDQRGGRETGAAGEGTGASAPAAEDRPGGAELPGGEPIDPETDPGAAFGEILDFSGLDVDSAPSDAAPQGRGTGVSSPDTEKNPADLPPEEREQIKSAPGDPPGGPRQSDTSGGEIPAGSQRENGKVDPNTRNYMATAGQGSEGAQVPSDAQIRPDPNLNPDPAGTAEGRGGNEIVSRPAEGGEGTPDAGEGTPNRGGPAPEADRPTGESGGALPAAGEGGDGESTPLSGGSGSASGKDRQGEAAAADKANLEYTRKATNLVLTYLDGELKKKPSPELLDRLGWTEEELRAFHEKWTEMRVRAGETPAAQRRYNDELRDMGLRPKGVRISGRGADRKSADSARTADRTPPPDDVAGRLREYNEAINRGE